MKESDQVFCTQGKSDLAKHPDSGRAASSLALPGQGRSPRGAREDLQLPVDNVSAWTGPPRVSFILVTRAGLNHSLGRSRGEKTSGVFKTLYHAYC